jgi:hypothetical protein
MHNRDIRKCGKTSLIAIIRYDKINRYKLIEYVYVSIDASIIYVTNFVVKWNMTCYTIVGSTLLLMKNAGENPSTGNNTKNHSAEHQCGRINYLSFKKELNGNLAVVLVIIVIRYISPNGL